MKLVLKARPHRCSLVSAAIQVQDPHDFTDTRAPRKATLSCVRRTEQCIEHSPTTSARGVTLKHMVTPSMYSRSEQVKAYLKQSQRELVNKAGPETSVKCRHKGPNTNGPEDNIGSSERKRGALARKVVETPTEAIRNTLGALRSGWAGHQDKRQLDLEPHKNHGTAGFLDFSPAWFGQVRP